MTLFVLPYSLEEYNQQCGRAGRDGKPSSAYLMFSTRKEEYKPKHLKEQERLALHTLMEYATRKDVCRRRMLSRYFDGNEVECGSVDCHKCDVCCNPAEDGQHEFTDDAKELADLEGFFDTSDKELEADKTIHVTHAHILASDERHFGQQLEHFLIMFEKNCIVCLILKGKMLTHKVTKCPTIYGLCYRCLQRQHKASKCPNYPERLLYI